MIYKLLEKKTTYPKTYLFAILFAFFLSGTNNALAQVYDYVEEEKPKVEKEPAQKEKKKPEKKNNSERSLRERIYFGGNIAAWFGNVTFLEVAPLVGYNFTEAFSVGTGITYRYFRDDRYFRQSSVQHIMGSRIFTRYLIPISEDYRIFPYAEWESLRYQSTEEVSTQGGGTTLLKRPTSWYQSGWVGLGLQQPAGGRASWNLLVLYNVSWSSDNYIYSSPIDVRIGLEF